MISSPLKAPAVSDERTAARDRARQKREEELQLVQSAIEGDTGAFAELYDRHVVSVYRYINSLVHDTKQTEDLTAQTFLKAWEAIVGYKERGAPVVAWLLRIAYNLTISYLRSRREYFALEDTHVDQKLRGNPQQALDQSADEETIHEAILQLKDEQREVILLRFVEGLDYQEVAEMVGKSVPTVRVIQHRALGNLRKIMSA